MDKITFLTSFLGNGQRANRDYYQFHCPFCGHRKPKLGIALNTGKWRCWTCPSRGQTVHALAHKLRLNATDRQTAKHLWPPAQHAQFQPKEPVEKLLLPSGYAPIWEHLHRYTCKQALGYLHSRGVGVLDVRKHKIGYCTIGKYSDMVIFPSYSGNGALNYYNGRTFTQSQFKFRDPVEIDKNVVLDEWLVNWQEPVVIVEGRLDAIAVRRNAIPICGKGINAALRQKILDEGTPEIIFCLDGDALNDAILKSEYFIKNGIKVKITKLPIGQDPKSLGFSKVWEYIDLATELTQTYIFNYKIQNRIKQNLNYSVINDF